MSHHPKKKRAQAPERPETAPESPMPDDAPAADDGVDAPAPPAGESGDLGEDIEILDVTAADEAGVPLEDDEVVVLEDEDEEEEFDVPTDAFDMSSGRAPGGARSEDTEALVGELAASRAQAQELKEQLLRTTADFDNFRKRVERDRVEERKQATAGLVRNVLPVLDSFRWALVSAQKGEDGAVKSFADGFRLIETQLLDILKAAGLEPVDATGAFDPTLHEALMQETTTDQPHMTVLEVFEPGWRLGGRLLRPARVKVANNPSGTTGTDPDTTH